MGIYIYIMYVNVRFGCCALPCAFTFLYLSRFPSVLPFFPSSLLLFFISSLSLHLSLFPSLPPFSFLPLSLFFYIYIRSTLCYAMLYYTISQDLPTYLPTYLHTFTFKALLCFALLSIKLTNWAKSGFEGLTYLLTCLLPCLLAYLLTCLACLLTLLAYLLACFLAYLLTYIVFFWVGVKGFLDTWLVQGQIKLNRLKSSQIKSNHFD